MRVRDYRLVGKLFELLEGRRSLVPVVRSLQEELRGEDAEVDRLLCGLEERRDAAGRRAAAAEAEAEAGPPLAEVIPHPGAAADYSGAFAAAVESAPAVAARVEAERERAAADLDQLLDERNPKKRERLIRRSRSGMRGSFLVEGLLEKACAVRGADPRLALELTENAQQVARRTLLRDGGRDGKLRLVNRADAHRANALRVLGELPAADAAWRRLTHRRLRHQAELPDEEAELLSLEASLRIDLRQFEAAEGLLDRAERLYRLVGETVGAARALLKRGSAADYAGEPELAVALYARALELIDPVAEPRLFFMIQDNRAHSLVNLGLPAEATAALAVHPELFERVEDVTVRLRRRWIEGRIARAEERFEEAGRLFAEVRNGWLTHQRPYAAAVVTLDTAELHFARGNWREVKRQAALLEPIFAARGVHREARAALILFQQASNAETLTADFLARLRRYLLLARNDRAFRFDPPPAAPAG